MDVMREFFELAGSLICHQLPERSLMVGDMILPVCARDTGIYTGVFTAFVFLLLFRRMNAQRLPGLAPTLLMCVLMIPMMLDGALSYTGLIETNNTARLFTGLLFGLPLPFLLAPAANFKIDGPNHIPVLKKWTELILVYCTGVLVCILLLYGSVPYIAASLIFLAGFISLLARVSFTIFSRMGIRPKVRLYGMTVLGTILVLTMLYMLSSYVLQPLKDILYKG